MNLLRNNALYFAVLFGIVIFFFHRAFSIGFFQDDYFFIHQSQAGNVREFINFFNPLRTYSFKPLASEVFYFLLGLLRYNVLAGHVFVFLTYFLGLYFLYRVLKDIVKKDGLAKLIVFLYAIHFSHVFQLYWFATFQEVLVFTALTGSFFWYLRKKIVISLLFFTAALLSKETAVLFAPFLILFEGMRQRSLVPNHKRVLALYVAFATGFYLIFSYSLKYVTALDNYAIQPTNIKLFVNNSMWHMLWSMGAPNFMPDVLRSVFSPPLPEFQKYLAQRDFQFYLASYLPYLGGFFLYLLFLLLSLRQKIMRLIPLVLFSLVSFFLFLGPILFFPHKWMVRLMIPSVFIACIIGYLLFEGLKRKGTLRWLGFLVVVLYVVSSFFGTRLHESSSVYLLENRIYANVSTYMKAHKKKILKTSGVFFLDRPDKKGEETFWGQSKKLKSSLWDQYFLSFYFPERNMKAYYNFETKKAPPGVYIVPSYVLLQ